MLIGNICRFKTSPWPPTEGPNSSHTGPGCLLPTTPPPSLSYTLSTLPTPTVYPVRRVPPPPSVTCNPLMSVCPPFKSSDIPPPPYYWPWCEGPPCQKDPSACPVQPGGVSDALSPRAHRPRRKKYRATGRPIQNHWVLPPTSQIT